MAFSQPRHLISRNLENVISYDGLKLVVLYSNKKEFDSRKATIVEVDSGGKITFFNNFIGDYHTERWQRDWNSPVLPPLIYRGLLEPVQEIPPTTACIIKIPDYDETTAGGSVIDVTMYALEDAQDFDNWQALYGELSQPAIQKIDPLIPHQQVTVKPSL